MNFLCPACRTPLPKGAPDAVIPCTGCGVQVDLTRLDTSPGTAWLRPDVDLAGETLGGYRLLRRLASGGMGIVYEAEGPQGRCAVKVLAALLAADPSLRRRFAREAAALRELDHPGVVRVFAEGEERGFCWFAMERVEGPDLRTRLGQGPLAPAETFGLARALLVTLEEVHRRGLVHRDVKPANILLAASGPKLCDFGIARYDGSTTLTESAAILGSLRYMAPEQRQGRTSPQSDLYSLGVVLHEALAGGGPGEKELPRSAPRNLRRLVGMLLAERPAERPADAAAARAILDRSGIRAAIPAAAAVAAISLAVAAGLIFSSRAAKSEAGDSQIEVAKQTPVRAAAPVQPATPTAVKVPVTPLASSEGTFPEPGVPAAVQAQATGGESLDARDARPAKVEPALPDPDAGAKRAPAKVKAPPRKQWSKGTSTGKPSADPRLELKAAKLREERAREQAPMQESP